MYIKTIFQLLPHSNPRATDKREERKRGFGWLKTNCRKILQKCSFLPRNLENIKTLS